MLELRDADLRQRRVLRCSLLSAASLLCLAALQPAAAQVGAAPPPVQSPTSRRRTRPAAPLATNTVTAAETVLPPKTPDYFEATYPHYMKAPLPARGYHQRGIPTVIPQIRARPNPLRHARQLICPVGRSHANNAFFQDW